MSCSYSLGFLNTSAKLLHRSPLPAGATREQAVTMLQDHEFVVRCNPVTSDVAKLDAADGGAEAAQQPGPAVPHQAETVGETETYRVTDVVANPVWDSHVVSTYAFTDVAAGTLVRIRSPLGIVMDTLWEIRAVEGEAEADGEAEAAGQRNETLELVEDISITCSRLLMGIVKSQCQQGWSHIHVNMMKRLEREVKGESSDAGDAGDVAAVKA